METDDPHRDAIDEHDRLQNEIMAILNRHDPMGLAPGRIVPEDEYEHEANRIVGVLLPPHSRARNESDFLASEINRIWIECFSQDCKQSAAIAHDIQLILIK